MRPSDATATGAAPISDSEGERRRAALVFPRVARPSEKHFLRVNATIGNAEKDFKMFLDPSSVN
jgi:hypothetical protein